MHGHTNNRDGDAARGDGERNSRGSGVILTFGNAYRLTLPDGENQRGGRPGKRRRVTQAACVGGGRRDTTSEKKTGRNSFAPARAASPTHLDRNPEARGRSSLLSGRRFRGGAGRNPRWPATPSGCQRCGRHGSVPASGLWRREPAISIIPKLFRIVGDKSTDATIFCWVDQILPAVLV